MRTLLGIKPAIKKFHRQEQGAVLLIFALAVIPLVLIAGGALDYIRASQSVAGLQAALDGATLAVAQAEGQPDPVRIGNGQQFFNRNLRDADFDGTARSDFELLPDRVRAKARARIRTTLLKIANINHVEVTVTSEVKRPVSGKAEVVLVLDYSGSMKNNNKYQRMAKAATNFIGELTKNLVADSDVRFGLVPFSDFVAVDLPKQYVNGQIGPGTWTGCTQDRNYPFNQKESTPVLINPMTKWGRIHHFWDKDVDLNDPDEVADICDDFMDKDLKTIPLTNNYTQLVSKIKSMSPYANTNISLGMEFAWHLISPQAPFTEGKAYSDPKNHKFVVLLTDGKQTTKGYGSSQVTSVENAEENLEELCREMKKTNITVFTIGYDLEDAETLDRLRDCASNGKFYEPAVSGEDLNNVFADIGATVRASLIYINK